MQVEKKVNAITLYLQECQKKEIYFKHALNFRIEKKYPSKHNSIREHLQKSCQNISSQISYISKNWLARKGKIVHIFFLLFIIIFFITRPFIGMCRFLFSRNNHKPFSKSCKLMAKGWLKKKIRLLLLDFKSATQLRILIS